MAFPMVSHAASTRMRFWSLYIFLVEYAREMVTARGSPCEIQASVIKHVSPGKKSANRHDTTVGISRQDGLNNVTGDALGRPEGVQGGDDEKR